LPGPLEWATVDKTCPVDEVGESLPDFYTTSTVAVSPVATPRSPSTGGIVEIDSEHSELPLPRAESKVWVTVIRTVTGGCNRPIGQVEFAEFKILELSSFTGIVGESKVGGERSVWRPNVGWRVHASRRNGDRWCWHMDENGYYHDRYDNGNWENSQ